MSYLFGRLRSPFVQPPNPRKGQNPLDAMHFSSSFQLQDSSEVVPISSVVGTLISLYNQVDALIDEAKIKDQVAWELQTDLRFLPSVVAEVIPALNTGNSHFDRNFFRVVQLMCKALEEARGALDEYILANIHILQLRTLSRRLADARNRIRHAVSLYNTYCNTHQMTKPGVGPESISSIEVQEPRRISNVCSTDPLLKLKESLQELENAASQPCPRKILKLVARLRTSKYNMGSSLYKSFTMNELEHFCRVGGLEALVHLLSCPSHTVQKQTMANLQSLASDLETREKICSTAGALEQLGSLIISATGDIQQGAVAIVRTLLKNNDRIDVRRFALPGIIPKLMQLLTVSSPRVQANAAGVLWELCVVPQHRLSIAGFPGAAGIFVKLFNSPAPAVQFCAAAVLQNLCREKSFRGNVLATASASEKLLALLGADVPHIPFSRNQVTRKLEDLPSAGVVGWAVACLEAETHAEQMKGLDVLQKFPPPLMQIAVSEGAVLRLVGLLFSESTTIQEKAAIALWRLSIPDENEVTIAAQTSSISRLVAMLNSPVLSVQESAVKVLESLSFNLDNRKRIGDEEGAIQKLVDLLFLDSLGAQANAASALWNISNTTTKNKLRIGAAPGALQRLVDLLASDCTLVQEKAAGALMNLSYNGSNRRSISSLPNVFLRLVDLLESTSTLVHQNAAGALYNLSVTSDNGQAIANTKGALHNLTLLLRSMSTIVQEYAAGALANLAFSEETKEWIRQAGAIPLLKQLKQSSSQAVKTQAKRALDNCS